MVHQVDKRAATALSVIATQAVISILITLITLGVFSPWAAWSVFAGSVACMVINIFFSLRLLFGPVDFQAERFLRRLYRSEFQKLILTIIMFYAVVKWTNIGLPQFIVGFASATMAYWLILPFTRFEKFITNAESKTDS